VLVAAALIAVLSHIRFGSANTYHATFAEAAGLRAGQSVRIATVPVGKVDAVDLSSDNSVNVTSPSPRPISLHLDQALIRHERGW
jgi:phospholipid/cholesterol/gamma-HCH transport system substrate-binding protein